MPSPEARRQYDELCHRVKNELQVFTALFATQLRLCGHPEHYQLCVSRICASAALHETIDTGSGDTCELGPFLANLSKMLHVAFDSSFDSVTEVDGDITLDWSRARQVGLVVIEETLNALKYGVGDLKKGRIITRLKCSEGRVEVIVENSGTPISSMTTSSSSSGKGVTFMREIAKRLGGLWEISPSPLGTAMRLTFPVVSHWRDGERD